MIETNLERTSSNGTPIGGSVPMCGGAEVRLTKPDGSVWLKTGFLETDIDSYPDAPIAMANISPVLTEVFPTPEVVSAQDSSYDASTGRIYILDSSDSYKAKVYDADGVYLYATASLSEACSTTSILGLAVTNGKMYAHSAVNSGNSLYQLDVNGVLLKSYSAGFQLSNMKQIDHIEGGAGDGYVFGARGGNGTVALFRLDLDPLVSNKRLSLATSSVSTQHSGIAVLFGVIYVLIGVDGFSKIMVARDTPAGVTIETMESAFSDLILPFNNTYGLFHNGVDLMSATRDTDNVVKFQTSLGVGHPYPHAVAPYGSGSTAGANQALYYYVRIK